MVICANCFNDIELKNFISANSETTGNCNYCGSDSNSELIDFNEVSDFFSEFLAIFQVSHEGKSLIDIIAIDWNLFSKNNSDGKLLSEILSNLNSVLQTPIAKVRYNDDILECISYWEQLKNDLKWERRFLTDIDNLFELGWDFYFSNSIHNISKEEMLYRARIHAEGQSSPFNITEMSCPVKEKISSGRANPLGIPYLYLSQSLDTTLYEVRANYLDEISIGMFRTTSDKGLDLVDFTIYHSAFSYTVLSTSISEFAKSVLLKKLISNDLSKPLRRYDSELEYIPTQFICEFIRYITGADGILFNSSLHIGGKNIVLFNQNNIECIDVDKYEITEVTIESRIEKGSDL